MSGPGKPPERVAEPTGNGSHVGATRRLPPTSVNPPPQGPPNARKRNPGAVAAHGASEMDELGQRVGSEANRQLGPKQGPIHAELIGSDRCAAEGIIATGYAPVLALCRLLVVAGFDPATPLEAWRDETLCLYVRTIGEGAGLTIEDDRHGRPRLRRWRDRNGGCGASSPVRQIQQSERRAP